MTGGFRHFFWCVNPPPPAHWKLVVNLEDLVDFGAGVIGDSVQSQNISFSRSPLTAKQKLLLRLDDVCFFVTSSFLKSLPLRWRNGGVFSQHRRCSCPAKGEVILMSAIAIEWVFEKYHSNQSMAWRFIFVLSELFIYKGSIFVVWGLNFCSLKAQCCCVEIWNCWRRTD